LFICVLGAAIVNKTESAPLTNNQRYLFSVKEWVSNY
jgi:hypothetical protein